MSLFNLFFSEGETNKEKVVENAATFGLCLREIEISIDGEKRIVFHDNHGHTGISAATNFRMNLLIESFHDVFSFIEKMLEVCEVFCILPYVETGWLGENDVPINKLVTIKLNELKIDTLANLERSTLLKITK